MIEKTRIKAILFRHGNIIVYFLNTMSYTYKTLHSRRENRIVFLCRTDNYMANLIPL